MTTIASKLILDTRERDLIRETTKRQFTTQSLPVGDIWLSRELADPSNSKIELVIERKTHADLVASIKDGRWREQKSRLLTYCSEEGAQRHPIYIIEGSMQFLPASGGLLSVSTLRKFMNRLQIRYNIKVIQTDDLADTIAAIYVLAEQMDEDPAKDPHAFTAPFETKQYYQSVKVSKKENREDPNNFAHGVLMQCPGVSANVAEAILRHGGPLLADVFARDEKFIASINVTEKRKVGPVVAKRLLGLWNGQ